MKFTKWTFDGKDYYLSYNVMAVHQIYDLGIEDLSAAISDRGAKSFEQVCRAAEIMIQQGELVRRYLGYDPGNVISAETLMLTLGLNHDFALRRTMMEAVLDGLRSETDERQEVDLGLLELQKKTGNEAP